MNIGVVNGGGISNLGTMTVTSSTIASNSAGNDGGGVIAEVVATTSSIRNSTLHGNTANGRGGGIANFTGTLTLNNVTIASNIADADAGGSGNGGGIAVLGGTANFGNTILGDNVDSSPNPPFASDCSGTLNSLDYNLIETTAICSFTGSSTNSLVGVDPVLGPLQDNGGATLTRALLDGSPAIDAGNDTDPPNPGTAACEVADQRSVARPQGAACDMGAYEARPTIFLPMIFDTFTPTP